MAADKNEYSQILIEAAHRVLLELVRLLGEYSEGIVLVGGLVPGFLIENPQQEHIGSIDVDLALDHTIIQEAGYRSIKHLLLARGYQMGDQPFIFYRMVP